MVLYQKQHHSRLCFTHKLSEMGGELLMEVVGVRDLVDIAEDMFTGSCSLSSRGKLFVSGLMSD